MAKRLNKNLVIGLAALGFAVTTATGVLMVRSLQQTEPEEFIKTADDLASQEQWGRAAAYYARAYRAAVGKRDNRAASKYLVRAGDMLYQQGKEINALKQYDEAVIADAQSLEAHEKLLDLRLEIANMQRVNSDAWQHVVTRAEEILKLEGQENHPRALYAMGAALLGLMASDPSYEQRGVDYLKRAVELKPGDVDFSRDLARYYNERGELDKENEVLRSLAEHHDRPGGDAARAWCLYAIHKAGSGESQVAIEYFEKALALAGDDRPAQSLVHSHTASLWSSIWRRKKAGGFSDQSVDPVPNVDAEQCYATAVESCRRAIDTDPEGFDGYILLAELARINGDIDQAIEVLQERLDQPFRRQGLKKSVARVGRYAVLLGLADLYVTRAADQEPGSDKREELSKLADMHVEDALGEVPDGMEAAHTRGRVKYVQGKYRDSVLWFEQAERGRTIYWDNNRINLHYLAMARLQENQIGAAHDAIVQCIALPGATAGAWATYARILLKMERPQEAIEAANKVLAIVPGNNDATLIKAAALEQLGQIEGATKAITAIAVTTPELAAAQAQYLAEQNQLDEAKDKILAVLKENPTNPEVVRAAVRVFIARNEKEEAKRIVAGALAQAPDAFMLKMIAVQLEEGTKEERLAKYLEAIKAIGDDYTRAVSLVTFYDNEAEAEKEYEQLSIAKDLIINRKTPAARDAGENGLRSIVDRMFVLAADAKDAARIDAIVKEATSLNLDAAEGLTYRGRGQMVEGYRTDEQAIQAKGEGRVQESDSLREKADRHYAEAIETLKRALDKYPSSGETYAELGEAYMRTDRWEEAKLAFQTSNDLVPRNGFVLKRLAMLALQANNQAEYLQWLEQCEEVIPDDSWVGERLVLLQERDDPREGIARREELRQKAPDDVDNLIRLARLYQQTGDFDTAAARVDEALKVRSDLGVIRPAAAVLRSIKKAPEALRLLEQTVREVPADQKAAAQLLIGDHYADLDERRNADAAYLAAADIDANEQTCVAISRYFLDTSRLERADEWLKKAQAKAEESGSAQLASIKRMRIETLTRLERMEEARELCDKYLSQYPEDLAGIFLDSQVESGRGYIETAISKLSLYLQKNPDPNHPLALFRRAELLASMGKWQQAIVDLQKCRAAHPASLNFAPRVLLSKAYSKIGKPETARQELETVYAEHPEAKNVAAELLDVYLEQQLYQEADTLLTTIFNKDQNDIAWLVHSAIVLDEKGTSKSLANLQQKAMGNLKHAANLTGYDPGVTWKLLDAFWRLDLIEEGINYYLNTIPPDRRPPQVMLSYARLLAKRGDLADAADACRVALYRNGYGSFRFFEQLTGIIQSTFGPRALVTFQDNPPDQLFDRANQHILSLLHWAAGKTDQALTICRSLFDSATDDDEKVQLLVRMAIAHDSLKEARKSRELYEKALAIDGDDLIALNNLAFLLTESLKQPELAVPYAKHAAQIDPTPAVLDTLGWAYVQVGRLRDAIAALTNARRADPGFTPASYHLAEAYRRDGQFDNAKELFTEIVNQPAGPDDEYRVVAGDGLKKAQAQQRD